LGGGGFEDKRQPHTASAHFGVWTGGVTRESCVGGEQEFRNVCGSLGGRRLATFPRGRVHKGRRGREEFSLDGFQFVVGRGITKRKEKGRSSEQNAMEWGEMADGDGGDRGFRGKNKEGVKFWHLWGGCGVEHDGGTKAVNERGAGRVRIDYINLEGIEKVGGTKGGNF